MKVKERKKNFFIYQINDTMWNLQAIMPNNLKRNNIKRIKEDKKKESTGRLCDGKIYENGSLALRLNNVFLLLQAKYKIKQKLY